jgi:uncharacterized protein YggE
MYQEETKKLLKVGTIAVILLAVFLAVEALGALKALSKANPAYNSISVTGEGEAIVVPDIATFSFTVSSDAKTVAEAQSAVTDKMNTVLSALKKQGIEDKDIKTSDYNVYPRYSYTNTVCTFGGCPPSRQVLEGYTASHSISVKVRATDKVGDALAAAGDNGATNISSIVFTQDDPNAAFTDARAKAIKDAETKAKVLAKQLGIHLVRVVSFSDNTQSGYPMPMAYGMSKTMDVAVAQSAPTIPTGENQTKVSVTVVYEIR